MTNNIEDEVVDVSGELVPIQTLIDRLVWRQSNPVQWKVGDGRVLERLDCFICVRYHVHLGVMTPRELCSRCHPDHGSWWKYRIRKGVLLNSNGRVIKQAARVAVAVGTPVIADRPRGRPGGFGAWKFTSRGILITSKYNTGQGRRIRRKNVDIED